MVVARRRARAPACARTRACERVRARACSLQSFAFQDVFAFTACFSVPGGVRGGMASSVWKREEASFDELQAWSQNCYIGRLMEKVIHFFRQHQI